jgi:hypothetical protein
MPAAMAASYKGFQRSQPLGTQRNFLKQDGITKKSGAHEQPDFLDMTKSLCGVLFVSG